MSQENVEVVRAMDEAFFGRTPEGAIEFFDPNVEVDATARPDGRIWHGHEGLRRAMIEWVETWEDWRANTERYIDVPPDQVIALWREQGRGKGSGVLIDQRGANVYTLRNGRIIKFKMFRDREQAFEAAGLLDQDAHADS